MKIVLVPFLLVLVHFAAAQNPGEPTVHIINNIPEDPFPKERAFIISKVIVPLLPFKKGDLIKIHTQRGLQHYRNNKLLNQYKITPQLTLERVEAKCKVAPCFITVSNKLVYFMGASERFIDIRNQVLLVSSAKQTAAHTPTKAVEMVWHEVYVLKPVNQPIQ